MTIFLKPNKFKMKPMKRIHLQVWVNQIKFTLELS